MQVEINPKLLNWAIERSMKSMDKLVNTFPNLEDWLEQTKKPTFKQLEKFAKATFTPIGIFLLQKPPNEVLPITDFRTFKNDDFQSLSANLLDTIYASQQRQDWYKTYSQQQKFDKLSIVGKYKISDDPKAVAQELNEIFSFHHDYSNRQEALSGRTKLIEKQRILVMSSGVALGNTHRSLSLEEFRGFALSDDLAPVIFINSKDTIAARSFTLMHELAHIVIAQDGVSNTKSYDKNFNTIEKWCNKVAAEILVPSIKFKKKYLHDTDIDTNLNKLAEYFKVSTLVILGRIYDLGYISQNRFWKLFKEKEKELKIILNTEKSQKRGGNYYNSKPTSVSKLFIKTITASALEGNTLYRDAMQLTHIKSIKTFNKLTKKIHPWSI